MTSPSDPASATPSPLRANDAADPSDDASGDPTESTGTAERPRVGVNLTSPDPRQPRRFAERDVAALTFIGEAAEVSQGQLHLACFDGRAESIVSRWVRRMAERRLIVVERWNRNGISRIRLTTGGRDAVVARGVEAARLFVPRRFLALSIVAHSLTIVDALVALRRSEYPPSLLLTAWALQRCHRDRFPVIPDFLAVWARRDRTPRLVVAGEIDTGSESLRVFVPKLHKLSATIAAYAASAPSAILVLTSGARRAEAIRQRTAEIIDGPTLIVGTLPTATGRRRIEELQVTLSRRA